MKYLKVFFIGIIFLLGLTPMSLAEDYSLQYFLSKASSKKIELSKKELAELFDQLEEVMKKAQKIRSHLMKAIQTGETDVRYQEGKFWMVKLEEDKDFIEAAIQQIKLLRERSTHLLASIKLYKNLKDLSSHFNTYNNMTFFSSWVGDLAPEMELWADPVFYKLHLLPLAHLKDPETKTSQKEKKSTPAKEKKPTSDGKKAASKEKKS
ncbi:MAG: hypothetical protein HXY44_19205 [Syntrophaceae bacterium]|nr:hypothetical protein [Syntrophaceae bacterium]